ncbi:MAG: hypothetical protein QM765_22445 [Myxococcales bacterium]
MRAASQVMLAPQRALGRPVQAGAGGVAGHRFVHDAPSHSHRSPRRPLLAEPPNRTVVRVSGRYAIAAAKRGSGPPASSFWRSTQESPSDSQVSPCRSLLVLPKVEETPPNRTRRPRALS